uniref:Protein kinase domain-containing protein n=1 Tax=Pyramimonas obovata TaxID=1411642 RepID=A0A7S0N222_9CHLO|mmetsp:Transcript_18838/g.41246  ORF Transcript_18838/g.41246 Transcript_18838/m.41246 type:complete len:785 (+) Transcript_18838:79-2433(+)
MRALASNGANLSRVCSDTRRQNRGLEVTKCRVQTPALHQSRACTLGSAKPGFLGDTSVLSRGPTLQRDSSRSEVVKTEAGVVGIKPEWLSVGKQLGEGSFGVVYEGTLTKGNRTQAIVLKRAKAKVQGSEEMADIERLINERVVRRAAGSCARYLGSCKVTSGAASTYPRLTEGLWLIWRLEGRYTLSHYMRYSTFPRELVDPLLGEDLKGNTRIVKTNGPAVDLIVAQKVMQNILSSLSGLHNAGMVHRDVKPQNLVLVEGERCFKLIDLGACADLRTGINFVPDETILDPKYAAPEEYVLPLDSAPDLASHAAPIALALGATSWMQHNPDRFDMYAVGLIMLQLCLPSLRSDIQLQRFNRELRKFNYDLMRWRRSRRFSARETMLLDEDNGAGWELAQQLLSEVPKKRPAASVVRYHRWFSVKLDPDLVLPGPDYNSNSVADAASTAMKEAMARLRVLENAVLRVEATRTKQTSKLNRLKTESNGDVEKIAAEEQKLQAIEQGLQKRVRLFEAMSTDIKRMLFRSETQLRIAEQVSDTQMQRAEQARLEAGGEDVNSIGFGTRVKRAAKTTGAVGRFVGNMVKESATEAARQAYDGMKRVGSTRFGREKGEAEDSWTELTKTEYKAAENVTTDPLNFLASLVSVWNRKPEVPEEEQEELKKPIATITPVVSVEDVVRGLEDSAADEPPPVQALDPPPERVLQMRDKMTSLEKEVEEMAQKMELMEARLREQRKVIAQMEQTADLPPSPPPKVQSVDSLEGLDMVSWRDPVSTGNGNGKGRDN